MEIRAERRGSKGRIRTDDSRNEQNKNEGTRQGGMDGVPRFHKRQH